MKKKGPSWQHAPTPEGYKKLVEAAERTDQVSENKFMLYLEGILGFRAGETAHIKLSWFDFQRGIISIPSLEPCECQYCVRCARSRTTNEYLSRQEVRKIYWQPKTDESVRMVPYKLDTEVKEVLEEVITKYGRNPRGVKAMGYHFHRLIKLAGGIKSAYGQNVTQHGLRAFAATQFAYADYSIWEISELMGWKDIQVATHYLAKLGVTVLKFNKKYRKNEHNHLYTEPRKLFSENESSKQENVRKISYEENVWLKRYTKS